VLLLVAGLSGPFSLLLVPIALTRWLHTRGKETLWRLLAIAGTAGVQTAGLLFMSHASRLHNASGLTLKLVVAVVVRQVIMSSLIGANGYLWLVNHVHGYLWIVVPMTGIVALIVSYVMWNGPFALRLFVAFAGLVLFASLLSPTGNFAASSALKLLSRSTDGVRYWLIPMAAVLGCLVCGTFGANHKMIRVLSGICLTVALVGIAVDFQDPMYSDYNFAKQIQSLSQLPPGQTLVIPINPPGWTMELRKP
jgi:hypothetical protein